MVNDNGFESQAQLKAHLKTLHASLAETGTVDEELRSLLRQLDGDIHQLLQQRTASESAAAPVLSAQDEGMASRAQELAARFAAQHPRMEPALRQLGNMLSNMGI